MYQMGWRTAFGQKRNKIRKLFEISSMLLAWLLWASSNLSSSLHLLHCFLFCNHPLSCTESFKYQIRLIPRKIFWSFNFQSDIMTSFSLLSKLTKVFYFLSTLLQLTVEAHDFLRLRKNNVVTSCASSQNDNCFRSKWFSMEKVVILVKSVSISRICSGFRYRILFLTWFNSQLKQTTYIYQM